MAHTHTHTQVELDWLGDFVINKQFIYPMTDKLFCYILIFVDNFNRINGSHVYKMKIESAIQSSRGEDSRLLALLFVLAN